MEPPPPESLIEEPLLSPGFTCRVERPIDDLLVRRPPVDPASLFCVRREKKKKKTILIINNVEFFPF